MNETTTKITIKHRWTNAVLFECDVPADVESGMAMRWALEKATTDCANLRDADLSGADLRGADLSGADLRGANLRGANLSDANLRGANLSDADLSDADLSGANLRDADLSDADLRGANLRGADLRGADLRGANLSEPQLRMYRDDIWAVLSSAPQEAPAVLDALRSGRVDGSTYEGDCACLVGTIAKARACSFGALGSLAPDSSRAAEQWFMQIRPGQTPDNHKPSALAAQWVSEWVDAMTAAFGPKVSA